MHTMAPGMGGMGMAPGMGPGNHAWTWWTGGWGTVTMVLVVLVLAGLAGWIAGRARAGRDDAVARAEPATILRERFARGELDLEEFDTRRRALRDADE